MRSERYRNGESHPGAEAVSAVYLLFEDESILHGSLRIDTPSYERLAGQRSPTLPLERRYDFGVDGLSGRVVSCQAEKRAPPVRSLDRRSAVERSGAGWAVEVPVRLMVHVRQ